MPVYESESLVLKSYNLAEADRIVVFFTRDHGIVRGVAKGAKRLKSRFGSTLEPFSTVNLAFFQKEERELVSIQSVELARSCFESASNPEFLQTFSYIADLLISIVPPHDPNEVIYRMAKACVSTELSGSEDLQAIRLYFELWLLRLGGYLPDWSNCAECSRRLALESPASLSHDLHLVCDDCRGKRRLPAVTDVQRTIFGNVQILPPTAFVEKSRGRAETVSELSEMLRRIVTQVVGRDLVVGRSLALTT